MATRQKHRLTAEGCAIIAFFVVALFVVGGSWFFSHIKVILIIAGILIWIIILYSILRGLRIKKIIASEIDKHLRKALEIMDTTGKWYNNENEANRELVTCLKAQGVEAEYQYRLPNGRTADAKVGDILIEGKLSPDTAEVDRLVGQLSNYTQYNYKVNIVVYGWLDKKARKRIENEIIQRYAKRVFLTYLDNPRRQRTQYDY